jgi:hypothetical protein
MDADVTSAWRKSNIGTSASDWIPAPEPERPRGADARRSPEATARRRARKVVRRDDNDSPPAPPTEPTSSPPDFSVRTADACSWDANGRYSRWLLPTHSGRPALSPEYLQKMLTAQRARIMRDD